MINFHMSETFWSFELKKNPCTQAGAKVNPCATLSRPRCVQNFLLILNKNYVSLLAKSISEYRPLFLDLPLEISTLYTI